MEHQKHLSGEFTVIEMTGSGVLVRSPQDFLDLVGTLGAQCLIFRKSHLDDRFYDLRSGLAGEIMQKVSNYQLQMGVVGDFGAVESRSFQDFIRECNSGRTVLFKETVQDVLSVFRG